MVDEKTGIVAHFCCLTCATEAVTGVPRMAPRDYGRLEIGVTPEGHLVIWCLRHDKRVVILRNESIANDLKYYIGEPCGGPFHGKEADPKLHASESGGEAVSGRPDGSDPS